LESRIRENRTYGIDEGELEIEPFGHYASSLLYRSKPETVPESHTQESL
jgi:hypothetical protein